MCCLRFNYIILGQKEFFVSCNVYSFSIFIKLALQLPNGERVQDEFQTEDTVWQVLLHWDAPMER